MRSVAALLAIGVMLGGCAIYPSDPEGQIKYHLRSAQSWVNKGAVAEANFDFKLVLDRPSGGTRLREHFASEPQAQKIYVTGLESSVSGASSVDDLIDAASKVSVAGKYNLIPAEDLVRIRMGLGRTAVNGNQSGRLPFTLADKVDSIPELGAADQQVIILERTLNMVRDGAIKKPPVSAVMAYASKAGTNSDLGKQIEALLPAMKVQAADLPAVEALYPAYAAKRREEISGRVYLESRNADRIFQADLRDAMKRAFSRIVLESAPGPGITTVVLEKIRQEERITPERSETITYAQHEVNIISAALLMPKNASYIYDVIKGGNEVEYGFSVTASYGGRTIYDELLRGKVGGNYVRCSNARVQNVFGGVTSAGFVANSDMESRCSSTGASPRSVEDLRGDVIDKLVEGILKVPPIQAAYDSY